MIAKITDLRLEPPKNLTGSITDIPTKEITLNWEVVEDPAFYNEIAVLCRVKGESSWGNAAVLGNDATTTRIYSYDGTSLFQDNTTYEIAVQSTDKKGDFINDTTVSNIVTVAF